MLTLIQEKEIGLKNLLLIMKSINLKTMPHSKMKIMLTKLTKKKKKIMKKMIYL